MRDECLESVTHGKLCRRDRGGNIRRSVIARFVRMIEQPFYRTFRTSTLRTVDKARMHKGGGINIPSHEAPYVLAQTRNPYRPASSHRPPMVRELLHSLKAELGHRYLVMY